MAPALLAGLAIAASGQMTGRQTVGDASSTTKGVIKLGGDLGGTAAAPQVVDGTITATGSTNARTLRDRFADVVNVRDFGAKGDGTDATAGFTAAAAVANAGSGRTIYIPDGAYTYTGGLAFTSPVRIVCGPGAVLSYTGTGYAAKLGPDGLNDSTYQIGDYTIEGCTFSGGASGTHGIFVNQYVVSPKVLGTRFQNFGPTAAGYFALYFAGANWRASVSDVTWWNASGCRNFIGMANDPNSKLEIIHTQASQSTHCGVGIYINGWHNSISHSKIEAFTEPVVIGSAAGYSTIDDVYVESFDTTGNYGCFGYEWAQGVVIRDSYCNAHSGAELGKGSFLYPRNGGAQILNSTITGNRVKNLDATAFLVKQIAGGGTGNSASDNVVNDVKPVPAATTHSYLGPKWTGTDGDGLSVAGAVVSNLLISGTAPTISSGFGTSPSIVFNNGTAAFLLNVGTGGTASSGVIGLPSANTGWNCTCEDISTFSSTVFRCRQITASNTSATIGNFNSAAAPAAWASGDVLNVTCMAR